MISVNDYKLRLDSMFVYRYEYYYIFSFESLHAFSIFIPMLFFWCEYIFGNLLVVWHKNIWDFFGGRGDGNLGGFFSHKFIFAKIVELNMIFFLFSFFFVCFSRLFTTSLLFFYTFVHLHKRIIMASRALSARKKSRVYYTV